MKSVIVFTRPDPAAFDLFNPTIDEIVFMREVHITAEPAPDCDEAGRDDPYPHMHWAIDISPDAALMLASRFECRLDNVMDRVWALLFHRLDNLPPPQEI